MDQRRIPKPGEIYNHFKDKPYQIITVATQTETGEKMVVYQALYGDFKTYVRPLEMFLSEVDQDKYPNITQQYRFELQNTEDTERSIIPEKDLSKEEDVKNINPVNNDAVVTDGTVNALLLKFLDAESYNKKLDVLTSNIKHMNNRLINDMAVSLDCTVDEGPLDERIQGLIYCLQAMCRFEDRRLR